MSEAKLEQLVRAPRGAVFDAFVYPAIITKFWLGSTTGPLAPEAKVEWAFMVPGASETVQVTGFTQNQRIAFAWSDGVQRLFGIFGSGRWHALGCDTRGFGKHKRSC